MNKFVYIFGDSPTAKILNMLIQNKEYDFCVADIAGKSKVHRMTAEKVLNDLKNYDIIKETRKTGKSQMYKLRLDIDYVNALLELHTMILRTQK